MRQMKQPRKDTLREQLALAATEIIELRAALIQSGELLYQALVEKRTCEVPAATKDGEPVTISILRRAPRRPWWRRLLSWGRA